MRTGRQPAWRRGAPATPSAPDATGWPPDRTGTAAVVVVAFVLALCLPGRPAQAALSITVPATASLGSRAVGAGTLTADLGTVTVTNSALIGTWTATVLATDCTTGGGSANEAISRAALSYWSGPATATSGSVSVATPGQATALQAVSLSTSRTAFTALTIDPLSGSVSWQPTLSVTIPAASVAGTYTCVVTHSVA